MSRPLIQYGVGQLEDLFARAKSDPKMLKQLEEELKHRTVPRAVTLLGEVQAALAGSKPAMTSTATQPPQPTASPTAQRAPSNVSDGVHVAAPSKISERQGAVQATREHEVPAASPSQTEPAMSVEDAYNLLKSTPASTWESVEQMRRQFVQQSYPGLLRSLSPEKREQLLTASRRINAAYAKVREARRN